MGVFAESPSSCLPHWSLFALPELLVFLGSEPQQASSHYSGKHQLMCWLQILPLEPALPKTMLGFSKMHSSVSGWISGISLITVVPNVILIFHWLSSSIVALALILDDPRPKLQYFMVYILWEPGFLYHTSIGYHFLPQKDTACYLQLVNCSFNTLSMGTISSHQ